MSAAGGGPGGVDGGACVVTARPASTNDAGHSHDGRCMPSLVRRNRGDAADEDHHADVLDDLAPNEPNESHGEENGLVDLTFVALGAAPTGFPDRLRVIGWDSVIEADSEMLSAPPVLMKIKKLVKASHVSLLHVVLSHAVGQHDVKGATQLCRAQHRAQGIWLLDVYDGTEVGHAQLDSLRGQTYTFQMRYDDDRLCRYTNCSHLHAAYVRGAHDDDVEAQSSPFGAGVLDVLAAAPKRRAPPLELRIARDPGLTELDAYQRRRERAAEEALAVGGLRNPRASISGSPEALRCGRRVWNVIMKGIAERDYTHHLDTLGSDEVPHDIRMLTMKVRRALADEFGVRGQRKPGVQADIIAAIASASTDVDTEAVRWLSTSAPLGIERPIIPMGVFPLAEPTAAKSATDAYNWLAGSDNYSSYEEHQEAADANLRQELEQGRLLWARTKAELQKRKGDVTYNKIGVIAKVKQQLVKIRLIHDLRRSGVNAKVVMNERIVLPRLMDVVTDLLKLMKEAGAADWDELVLDFRDAFKQLKVDEAEQKYLGGSALGGYFVYQVLLFGIRSGPLIWGRVAALTMRITAAALYECPARLQCYVDDPILSIVGPPRKRREIALGTVLLWLVLGFDLSWAKGQYGSQVEWIGAMLRSWTSPTGAPGVTVTLPRDKIAKIAELLDSIDAEGATVKKATLRPFAGLATWVASILPQLNPFCRMIWAALAALPAENWVYRRQLVVPLRWFRAFTTMSMEPVERHCRYPPEYYTCITFDGSPWGGGATIQFGLASMAARSSTPIAAYWQRRWTAVDERTLEATRGDPASQARWEAFSMLLAVHAWMPLLHVSEGKLVICGDALGVLQDAVKFRGRDPIINTVMAELALLLAPLGVELEGVHIWSERNAICDQLSRVFDVAAPGPRELRDVPVTRDTPLEYRLLGVQSS